MKSPKVLLFLVGIICIISKKTIHCVEPVEFWDDDDDDDYVSDGDYKAGAANNKDSGGEIKNNPDDGGWWNWLTNNQEQDEHTETSTNKLDTTLQSKSTATSLSLNSDSTSPSILSDTSTLNTFQSAESNVGGNDQKQVNDTNGNEETSKSDSSSEDLTSSEDLSSSSSEDPSSKSDSNSDSSFDTSSENSSSFSSEDTSSVSNGSSEESSESNESKEEELNNEEKIDNENNNKIDFDDKINNDNSNDVDDVIEDVESTSSVEDKEKETWSEWFEHIVGNLVNGDDNDNNDDGDDVSDDASNDSLDDNAEFNNYNDEDNKDDQIETNTSDSHETGDEVPGDNPVEQDGDNFNKDDSTTIPQTTSQTQYQTSTNYQRSTEIPIETPLTTVDTNFQTMIPSVSPVNDNNDHMDNGQEVVGEEAPDLNAAVLGDDEEHIVDEAVNAGQIIPEGAFPNPLFQVPKVDDQDTLEHTDNISCKDVPIVVAETCDIPDVIVEKYNKDITIEDVKDYIFHPSKVEALIKDCRPGEWCMEEGIPLTQMNVDAIYGLCPLRQCLHEINEMCMTEERLLIRQSLALLCELHAIETVSINTSNCCDKCLVNVIVALHVQMADLTRQGREGVEQDVCTESDFYFLDTLCLRQPCSKTMARLMCLQQECPGFQDQFKTFPKWGGFFKDIDNISNVCSVGNATCFNNSLEESMKGQSGMMEKFKTMFWKNGNWKTLSGVAALLGISLIGVICVVFMYMRRRHRGHSYDRQDIEYSEVKSYDRL
ncbi:unnamed protein product [Owenia fusiformis]|uniref:Uncharacterized protein n=1 Tax=Owenia fusiformis TaxID=6347 RepID=A0A8J1UWD3_OWEFU|nr:unnamed protein product [Owenia fusiformis]